MRVNSIVGDRLGPARLLDDRELAADRRGFSCKLDPLMTDTTLLFTLTDSDGIESRDPVRLTLVATPDQPPQLAVQLDGIGTAITPAARVAVSGQITDDYGIGRVWFERAIDQQQPHTHVIAELRRPRAVYNLTDAGLDLRELGLKPGQRLSVSVKAADLCSLGHGPNVASTEAWLLDVVTPDQLRAMLGGAGVGVAAAIRADDPGDGRHARSAGADGSLAGRARDQGAGAGQGRISKSEILRSEILRSPNLQITETSNSRCRARR